MITNNLKKLGIVAVTALSLYGAGNLVSDIYHHFVPKTEQANDETYRLSLMYCDPERNLCESTVTPGLIILTRSSDSRSLWSADIGTYPNSDRPSVRRIWSDPELSDRLGGELTFDIIGSPK